MSDLAAVCFIACHGGPADHFATFAEDLPGVQIYVSELAAGKFHKRQIEVKQTFSTKGLSSEEQDLLAEQIAKACAKASVVMTDVGDAFDIKLQKAFALHAKGVVRLAYYDNPESFVPGGYSVTAAEVMHASHKVLFANSRLATAFDLPQQKIGLGYYPLDPAKKIAAERASPHRQELVAQHGLQGQKTLVYFGGNNETYFNDALPAFLRLLTEAAETTDLSSYTIVFQQHPGAKEKNLDKTKVEEWQAQHCGMKHAPKMVFSTFSSDEAQIVADAALYYQTSMGPQFVLAGIPAIQVGHEKYEDILVRNGLAPCATSATQLKSALEGLQHYPAPENEVILEKLGIKENWRETLKVTVKG
jgi:hypothetical protein